jgi:tetratricopeptide (TPR) repeat protein
MNKLSLVGGLLSAATWAYVGLGPSGLLPRAPGLGLTLPERSLSEQGATSAKVDLGQWQADCKAAGLPLFPDPNGLEFEPLKRLIEASQRWAANADGDELGRMGEIAMALELHEPAIDLFAAARALGEDVARWNYFLGAECQVIGASAAAIEALQEARDLDPSYATTYTRLGALYFELGEFEQADKNYALASRRQPSPTAGIVGRGRVALAQRDFNKALQFLDTAVKATPKDFLAHRLRSQTLASMGRTQEAATAAQLSNTLPSYRGWLTFDPRLADAHKAASTQHSLEIAFNLAISQGNLQAATRSGEALLKRLPDSPQVLAVLSRILANSGKVARGLELAQRAAQLEPQNLQALGAVADIASLAGNYAAGEQAAKARVALAPKDALGYRSLGRLYFVQGKVEACLEQLRIAVRLQPRDASHRLMLIDVLKRAKRFDEAELELEGILAIDPNNVEAKGHLKALRRR